MMLVKFAMPTRADASLMLSFTIVVERLAWFQSAVLKVYNVMMLLVRMPCKDVGVLAQYIVGHSGSTDVALRSAQRGR